MQLPVRIKWMLLHSYMQMPGHVTFDFVTSIPKPLTVWHDLLVFHSFTQCLYSTNSSVNCQCRAWFDRKMFLGVYLLSISHHLSDLMLRFWQFWLFSRDSDNPLSLRQWLWTSNDNAESRTSSRLPVTVTMFMFMATSLYWHCIGFIIHSEHRTPNFSNHLGVDSLSLPLSRVTVNFTCGCGWIHASESSLLQVDAVD